MSVCVQTLFCRIMSPIRTSGRRKRSMKTAWDDKNDKISCPFTFQAQLCLPDLSGQCRFAAPSAFWLAHKLFFGGGYARNDARSHTIATSDRMKAHGQSSAQRITRSLCGTPAAVRKFVVLPQFFRSKLEIICKHFLHTSPPRLTRRTFLNVSELVIVNFLCDRSYPLAASHWLLWFVSQHIA